MTSARGKFGGYKLAKPAKAITIGDVIRLIDGPLAPIGCVSQTAYEKCSCPDESRCAIRSVMKETRDAIVSVMERVTLAELAERARKLEQEPMSALDFNI